VTHVRPAGENHSRGVYQSGLLRLLAHLQKVDSVLRRRVRTVAEHTDQVRSGQIRRTVQYLAQALDGGGAKGFVEIAVRCQHLPDRQAGRQVGYHRACGQGTAHTGQAPTTMSCVGRAQ
jgi:hypothetical protein